MQNKQSLLLRNQIPKNLPARSRKAKEGWQKVKFGELFKIKHGYAFKGEYFSDKGKYILLTPGNFSEKEGLQFNKKKYYSGPIPTEYVLSKGDVLVVMTDVLQSAPYLGAPGIIDQDNLYLHNQRLGLIIDIDNKKANKDFLYWLFQTDSVRHQIRGSASGSTVKHTAPERIYSCEVSIPEEVELQKQIASILSTFDDKIEVNNKIAKTLEEMAQVLFKEWFVYFRFPGYEKAEFADSELGKIPKGWEVGFIKDLGKVVTGKTPSTGIKENFGSEFPFITIPDMNSTFIIKTERYLSKRGAEQMKSMLLPIGSICVSCIATVGLVGITTQQSLTNQQINSVVPNEEELTYFLYLYFKNKRKDLQLFGSGGTATLIINKTKFESLDLIIPDKNTSKEFHTLVKPMYEKILSINKENQKLAAIRDLLLPKLMKGEIRV